MSYERGTGSDQWEAEARVRTPIKTEECQHLLPKFLCRTCSASIFERAGVFGPARHGPLTMQEKKDMVYYQDVVAKIHEPAMIEAKAGLADVKRKIERYISNKI